MTSVTVAVDKNKKPQYKEYVNFLENYKSGKRNDCDFTSSSSSSITSDHSDVNEMPTKSFKEYLQDYNNKKYQPVQPNFIKKIDEAKNVKTEVFIQINNTANNSEKNENQIKITIPKPKLDDIDGEQIKVSVGKLSQKFNSDSNKTSCIKRSSSITEKTKLFEEKSEENGFLSSVSKRNFVEKFPKNDVAPIKKTNGHSKNQTFIEIRKQELQNNPGLNGGVSSSHIPSNKSDALEIFNEIEPISVNGNTDSPKENIKLEVSHFSSTIPPPPPLPPVNLPPKPVSNSPKTTYMSNSSPKPFNVQPKAIPIQSTGFNAKPIPNGYSTLPKIKNNKNESVETSTIDRSDPRVKKLVYGALREMYGAYHDKANDYLATLPKNRVKKGNGLDNIINTIAAQGGLEKLSGRANPKSETEQT